MSEINPLALEEQVCFAVAVAARSVVAVYRPVLEPMGLTHPQYLVMLALWEQEQLSVKELSSLLKLDPGTLSPLVKRLESQGYVTRGRDEHDERVLAITLTSDGRALRAEAEKVPAAIVASLGMDVERLHSLRRDLTAVISAAEQALETSR
jgi:DNA-binding MarR family transcriptional regulator